MIRVRDAKREDAAALGSIMASSFWAAFSGVISRETLEACAREESCIRLMEHICDEGKMRFLLGLLDNAPMGELIWSEGETLDSAEIQAIHSLPESWGTGLGTALLERALADMAEAGKSRVYLWAFAENKRARRFYEKNGFTWDGTSRTGEFDGAVEVRYVRSIPQVSKTEEVT